MGNRLSRIVTRTGDDGTTSLGDGTRVAKDSARIEAIGEVDELNSLIGLLISMAPGIAVADPPPEAAAAAAEAAPGRWLLDVQHDLFDLGAELSVPGLTRIHDARIAELEQLLESLNATLPALQEFVLPGGTTAAALCHLARTVCRRAERRCWALSHAHERTPSDVTAAATPEAPSVDAPAVNAASLRYLNRLSDLLFVLARVYARAGGGSEILWRYRRGQD